SQLWGAGYPTGPVAAGKSIIVSVYYYLPSGSGEPYLHLIDEMTLFSSTGDEINTQTLVSNFKATGNYNFGYDNDDLVVTSGSNRPLGGGHPYSSSEGYNYVSANALAPAAKATFNVQVHNDSSTAAAVSFSLSQRNLAIEGPCADIPGQTPWAVSVKTGGK